MADLESSWSRKLYSYVNLGAPVLKLIFHYEGGGHFGFGPLEYLGMTGG